MGKMPPNWKKMQKQWDKMFSRADADIHDVQCMFADTREGCHSFGLPGDRGCKFKHDILVEEKVEAEYVHDEKCRGDVDKDMVEEDQEQQEKEEKRPWQKKKAGTKKKK